MAKLSRRSFIARAVAGAALLAVAPYAFYQYRYGKPTNIVMAILHRRVGYLKVKPGTLERFAEEYVAYKRANQRQLATMSIVALPYTYFTVYKLLPLGHKLRRLEDNIVTKFLLSTDFFLHDADESRELNYLSFYEPHLASCRNPFAHLRKQV